MQSMALVLAITAASIEVASYILYIRDIRSGRARPSRASWLIWAPLSWLTLTSHWQAGADLTLVKLTGMCLGVTAVAALAIRSAASRSDGPELSTSRRRSLPRASAHTS